MSTFAHQLKSEISRLARKEVRSETESLRKSLAQHRSEIAALKKRVASLEASVKKLSKSPLQSARKSEIDTTEKTLRFRVEGFANLRKKLNLTAAEMAKLLGVSAQSVYHWETGKSKPRQSQLLTIASIRKLGKREVANRLSNQPAE